jgi:hypothetical protein
MEVDDNYSGSLPIVDISISGSELCVLLPECYVLAVDGCNLIK